MPAPKKDPKLKSLSTMNIAAQREAGKYKLVAPLDYIILDHLHPEGENFAGLYPIGHTADHLHRDALKSKVPMTILASRLSTLNKMKLIVRVGMPGTGGANAYQRTPEGERVLNTPEGQESLASWKAGESS